MVTSKLKIFFQTLKLLTFKVNKVR